jgi:hypothetical protein
VARLLRRRAAFIFAGVLFQLRAAPPGEQRSDDVEATSMALTFRKIECPPVALAELALGAMSSWALRRTLL